MPTKPTKGKNSSPKTVANKAVKAAKKLPPLPSTSQSMVFDDNSVLSSLYGEDDAHLARIEQKFDVTARSRGNILELIGAAEDVTAAKQVLAGLYAKLLKGADLSPSQVDAAIRLAIRTDENGDIQTGRGTYPGNISIKTVKRNIAPYSSLQAEYMHALQKNELVFALGPAGTGKTYIAVAMAVNMFISRRVERIILSRPAVEAGEKLGFLPGDLKEKVDPYLRPLYDALHDMIPGEKVVQYMENGEIEVAPLAFMRGRTLGNSFIILDEAQNTTPTQMKMFLTRLGENSRMVVTGDLSQTDLPRDVASGLHDAVRKLEHVEGIATIRFTEEDVVRHPLAARIVKAYDEWDRRKKQQREAVVTPGTPPRTLK